MTWILQIITKYRIYVGLVSFAFCFFLGWYTHGKFYAAQEKAVLEASIKEHMRLEQEANLKSLSLEAELAKQRVENLKTQVELQNEVNKPEYTACKLPVRSLQLINGAVRPDIPR